MNVSQTASGVQALESSTDDTDEHRYLADIPGRPANRPKAKNARGASKRGRAAPRAYLCLSLFILLKSVFQKTFPNSPGLTYEPDA